MRKLAKKLVLGAASHWIRRKTKLSKLQSKELADSLIQSLYATNGLHFGRYRMILRVMFRGIDWKHFCLTEAYFRKQIGVPKYQQDYREPIGIWYTIDSEQDYTDALKIQNTDHITYYASGREPLLAVANHVAQARKIVLVPYFTCGTVFQPFWENGWETVYYKVTRDLKIDTQDVEALYEQYKPSIAIFMEYSGMDLTESELQTIGKLKQAGCVTIVDRSQNIYSTQYAKEVDFYCGSLRKWYCCPDGAYLQKNGDIPLPPVPDAAVYNDVYATLCSVMMFTNALARKTNIKQYLDLASFFRKLSASYVCSQQVRTRNMSEYSKAVYLQEQNKDQTYMQRRSENFHYIYQRIASFSLMHPVCSDLSRFTSTPFYFHIYTRDRSDLSRFLTARGIATWVNWFKPKSFGVLDDETEFIFRHILSLPCDQRYTLQDMKILCDALEEYETVHHQQP